MKMKKKKMYSTNIVEKHQVHLQSSKETMTRKKKCEIKVIEKQYQKFQKHCEY